MAKAQSYVPAMADEKVKAKTGKDWAAWFTTLDKAGAAKLDHKAIATLLHTKHAVPGWWSQTVTVEYERARGLRTKNQKADGFTVSASKTLPASLASVYAATSDAAKRKAWFPRGSFAVSSQTENKYVNGAWNDSARINIGFYSKGANKAQIAIQVSKLSDAAAVDSERELWKLALAKLEALLAPSDAPPKAAPRSKDKRAKQ
jgi:hypothetical protein